MIRIECTQLENAHASLIATLSAPKELTFERQFEHAAMVDVPKDGLRSEEFEGTSPRAYGAKLRRAAAAVAAATSERRRSAFGRVGADRLGSVSGSSTEDDEETYDPLDESGSATVPEGMAWSNGPMPYAEEGQEGDELGQSRRTTQWEREDERKGSKSREEDLEERLRERDRRLKEALERQEELERELRRNRGGEEEGGRQEELEEELQRVRGRLEELEAGRRSARSALAEMASQNARLVSAFAAKKEEVRGVREELQRVQAASSERADALEAKLRRAQEEISSLKDQLHREREKQQSRRQYTPLEEERERFSNERARWEAERAKLEAENHALRDQLEALRTSHGPSRTPPHPSSSSSNRRHSTGPAPAPGPSYPSSRDRRHAPGRDANANGPTVSGRSAFWRASHGHQHAERSHGEKEGEKEPQTEAERCKADGNSAFHQQKFEEAVEQYTAGLGKDDASTPVKAALHCNRAAAHQATRNFIAAAADCHAALDLDSSYQRAFQRRAEAFYAMGDFASATRDLESAGAPSGALGTDAMSRYEEAKRKAKRELPPDYYAVLGISSSASGSEIKAKYRQLALKHHPDKATDHSDSLRSASEALFKLINQAYATLSDPSQKRKYDTTMLAAKLRRQNSFP